MLQEQSISCQNETAGSRIVEEALLLVRVMLLFTSRFELESRSMVTHLSMTDVFCFFFRRPRGTFRISPQYGIFCKKRFWNVSEVPFFGFRDTLGKKILCIIRKKKKNLVEFEWLIYRSPRIVFCWMAVLCPETDLNPKKQSTYCSLLCHLQNIQTNQRPSRAISPRPFCCITVCLAVWYYLQTSCCIYMLEEIL